MTKRIRNIEMIFAVTRWQKPIRFDYTNKPDKVGMRKKEEKTGKKDMALYVIHLPAQAPLRLI